MLSSHGFSQDINISSQPSAVIECFGNSTSIYVLAYSESKQELKYQWYKDDTKLVGANSPLFKFENLNHNHTGLYYCEISNNVEIIRTKIAPVYVLRITSITKEPEDVTTYLDGANVSINFEAHVNGKSIDEAINDGDLVYIQWYQKIENSEIKLDNKDIYDGVNSSRLNINTKSLADTSYYFAQIEGECGKARTRTVRIIKNLLLLNLTMNGLEACEGNFEIIKASVNNPNNYELKFQWYKNDKAIHYKENLDGYYSDELRFNPIHLLDSGIYKLEARIKGTNYSVLSNEVKVNICSKPEIIAVRIDSLTTDYFLYKSDIMFNIYYKKNCDSKIDIYKNDGLFFTYFTDSENILNCNIKNDKTSDFIRIRIDKKDKLSKYSAKISNRCGIKISDSLTINNDLNIFDSRDPWHQYRDLCEGDTTTIESYFTNLNRSKIQYHWETNAKGSLYDENFYIGYLSNKLHFKKLRTIDNGVYRLDAKIEKNKDNIDTNFVGELSFFIKVNPIPHLKRQPKSKTLNYDKKDTLFYIVFDNDKQIPMSLDLYYMASLTSKPRLIDKSEAEWGLWFRYIKEVTFADKGYYYAVAKHYNDCKSVISDTIYIDVLPAGITSIDDIEKDRIIISPNPATDYITINLSSTNPTLKRGVEWEIVVEIYDSLGELLISDVRHLGDVGHLNEIDVSNLSPGVYFVKIGDKVEKFIKM